VRLNHVRPELVLPLSIANPFLMLSFLLKPAFLAFPLAFLSFFVFLDYLSAPLYYRKLVEINA
jgi:hypothetical protein